MNIFGEIMGFFAGFRTVAVEEAGDTFPMAIMYPTETPEETIQIGPYRLDVAKNAAPAEGSYPLIIISHGSGGSHLVYRTLARHLASNGFIVGMPEHPFNNRNDNSLDGTVENLDNRPRLICAVIDWFYEGSEFSSTLRPNAVSIVGHSMGGYTGLAVAGGIPTSFPRESPDGQSHEINVSLDERIQSLVLMAPAAVWYREQGALSKIDVPILMLAAEKDRYTPYFHSQIVLDGLPDHADIEHRVVENAGHFSFLSPFPPKMSGPAFFPAHDPPGFDRTQFHETLNAEVLGFLQRKT